MLKCIFFLICMLNIHIWEGNEIYFEAQVTFSIWSYNTNTVSYSLLEETNKESPTSCSSDKSRTQHNQNAGVM